MRSRDQLCRLCIHCHWPLFPWRWSFAIIAMFGSLSRWCSQNGAVFTNTVCMFIWCLPLIVQNMKYFWVTMWHPVLESEQNSCAESCNSACNWVATCKSLKKVEFEYKNWTSEGAVGETQRKTMKERRPAQWDLKLRRYRLARTNSTGGNISAKSATTKKKKKKKKKLRFTQSVCMCSAKRIVFRC